MMNLARLSALKSGFKLARLSHKDLIMSNAEIKAKYEEKLTRARAAMKAAVGRDAKNAYSAQVALLSEMVRDLESATA